MLLRSNSSLFDHIKALSGVNDFTTEETANILSFVNRRLVMAYNTSPMWDRYLVTSENRILSAFKLGTRLGQDTYHDTFYYKYGQADTGNGLNDVYISVDRSKFGQTSTHFVKNNFNKWTWGSGSFTRDPITKVVTFSAGIVFATQQDTEEKSSPLDVKDWGAVSSVGGTLDLEARNTVLYSETFVPDSSADAATLRTKINNFIRVHADKAFVNRSATEYDFYVDEYGANIMNVKSSDQSEVYVTYQKPILNQTTHDVVSNLNSGSQVPTEFFNYTAHGAFADFLRMDGQHDKASVEEQKAGLFLATELERIDIINNNNSLNRKISTYINRTLR